MLGAVSTHTRSLAFISAGLKTRNNFFKQRVKLNTGHDSSSSERQTQTFLSYDFAYVIRPIV